jgi:lambda family phage portal protein
LEARLDRVGMVDRARQLERESTFAETLLSASVENVSPHAPVLKPESADPAWNAAAKALWADWCAAPEVRGLSTWSELLALIYRSWLRDGDVGVILLSDGLLQAIESDQISSPRAVSPDMVDGIRLDRRGRPVDYSIVDVPDVRNPAVRYQSDRIIVPAESVIFLAKRQRLGQTRGTPAFTGSAWIFDQIDGTIEAVTVAARMAASFGLVITQASTSSGLPMQTGSDGAKRPEWRLEPGMFKTLREGEAITQIKPEQPTAQFEGWIKALLRFCAIEFALPLELFFDFRDANWANHKGARLASQRNWRVRQRMLEGFSKRVYTWKLIEWIRSGLLRPRADALAHSWTSAGWRWLDPVKEIQAALAECDLGVRTPSMVAEAQGHDYAEIVARRRADRELQEGLPLVSSTLTRDEGSATPTPEAPPAP